MHNQFRFSKDYLVKLLSALFIMAGSVYASLEYEQIYGDKGSNKIKLFIFAEGYADFNKNDYQNDVKLIIDTLFSISPYKEYKNLFNVYRVWTPSHWSFVPSKESDSTFFGGYRTTGGPKLSDRGMQYFENILTEQKDSNFLCDEFVWNQQSIVLYNAYGTDGVAGVSYMQDNLTLLYSGGGGNVLAHELGHQIARLGDEYEKAGYEVYDWPETANTTKKTTLDSIPWRYWIKSTTPIPTPETAEYSNVIGLFEGAQYSTTGWYRPSQSCRMRVSASYTFCNVCREAITSSILKYTHFTKNREFLSVMVDSVSPRMKTTVTSGKIMVTYAQIDSFPIKLSWRFNDSLLSDTSRILDLSAFKKNGTIKAIVEGNSGFIITPSYMPKDTIQWTFMYNSASVKISSVTASNNMIRQIRNGVYYIPRSAYGKFYISDMLGRNVPIRTSKKFADHMIVDLNKYTAKGKYMIVYKDKD
jgi:hypothetical protein